MALPTLAVTPDARWYAALGAFVLTLVAVSYGVVMEPWLLIGVVSGAIVLMVAIAAPLALVALTLMLGGVDLSFMTGGFKSLFPALGGLDMNGIRLVGMTIGFTAYIMNAPIARAAVIGRQGLAYLIFITYAFLTLGHSLDALEGLRLHLKLAYPFLTFLLVIGLCDTRDKVEKLATYTLAAAAIMIFVINPLYTLHAGYHIDYFGFRRVRGLGGHENPFSFYLMAMLFISFARLIYRKQRRYLLLCAGAAFWIAMTMTRITFLATILGILVITGLAAVAQKQYKAVAGGLIVALALALPGLPFVLERSLGYLPTPGELFELVTNPVALYEAINWQGRTSLWPVVWAAFQSAPVVGLGLGSSGAVLKQHFPSDMTSLAHNEYLRLGADAGTVGIALFALAMLVWLLTALRATTKSSLQVSEYAVATVAGIIAWSIISITDNAFDSYMYYTQYIGFLMGATMVLRRLAAQEQHVDRRLS